MVRLLKNILVLGFVLVSVLGHSQVPQLSIPKDSIVIGEQIEVFLRLTFPKKDSLTIQWPGLDAQFAEELEVIDSTDVVNMDAASGDDNLMMQQKKFTVTAWDSGYYAIDPFEFIIQGRKVQSGSQHIYVNTVAVDLNQPIKGIVDIYEEPFDWRRFFLRAWPYALGLLALGGLLYLLIRYIEGRKIVPKKEIVLIEPAHVIAKRSLDLLKEKDLLKHKKEKEYQSELTGILRTYLENRYEIQAMEQTTGQTINSLKYSSLSPKSLENLSKVLNMADEVKFAKGKLGQQLNVMAFTHVQEFVEETKLTEEIAPVNEE